MNPVAEQHLVKAKEYLAKGREFHLRAKTEIEAAIAEGASLREVSRILDISKTQVARLRDWDGEGFLYADDTERRQIHMTKQVLRESAWAR